MSPEAGGPGGGQHLRLHRGGPPGVDRHLLALSDARQAGARLVVTGCMAERYGDELADALPEVDLVAPFGASLTGSPGAAHGTADPGDPRAQAGGGPDRPADRPRSIC